MYICNGDTVWSSKTLYYSGDMQMINQDCFKVRDSGNLHLAWPVAKQINFPGLKRFNGDTHAIRWAEHVDVCVLLTDWLTEGYWEVTSSHTLERILCTGNQLQKKKKKVTDMEQ